MDRDISPAVIGLLATLPADADGAVPRAELEWAAVFTGGLGMAVPPNLGVAWQRRTGHPYPKRKRDLREYAMAGQLRLARDAVTRLIAHGRLEELPGGRVRPWTETQPDTEAVVEYDPELVEREVTRWVEARRGQG
jgi:hypothetical protein